VSADGCAARRVLALRCQALRIQRALCACSHALACPVRAPLAFLSRSLTHIHTHDMATVGDKKGHFDHVHKKIKYIIKKHHDKHDDDDDHKKVR
jgi:hypothetical protein